MTRRPFRPSRWLFPTPYSRRVSIQVFIVGVVLGIAALVGLIVGVARLVGAV